jgi:hypothetical protein
MNRSMWRAILAVVALVSCTVSAHGHRPLAIGGSYPDRSVAIEVEDIEVSQVAYAELTLAAPQLWLTFFLAEPAELHLSLGVPAIERLRRFTPALAVLGPGMAPVDVPFPLFDGLGGLVVETRRGTRETFFEPFTGTTSWTLAKAVVPLPAAGRYYVVAYAPGEGGGKLWVSVGTREFYGLEDVLGLPTIVREVRAFHEVPPDAPRGLLQIGASVGLFAAFAGLVVLLGLR